MKEKLTNNFGLKILSLILAMLLWFVVMNIEDPVITRDFSEIPVTEINVEKITDAGMAYNYVNGNTVSVKVRGKTSIVGRMTKDDLRAVADLGTLSITGAVTVDVTCSKYPGIEISPVGSSTVLKVEIEEQKEKSLNVKVITSGSVPEGCYIASSYATSTPNMVTVSGPKSEVEKVSDAVVYVSMNNNSSDVKTTTELSLLDSAGTVIASSTLNISQTSIDVTVPIYQTKTVPVNFDIVGEVKDGYDLVSTVYEPKEVVVAGREQDLKKIDSVTLKDYSINNRDVSFEDSVVIADNLKEELPTGVVLTDKTAAVAIAVTVEEIKETAVEVPLNKILLKGTSNDYDYTKMTTDETQAPVSLTFSGWASDVKNLSVSDLEAVADVTGKTEGTYELPLEITTSKMVTPKNTVNIMVSVQKKSGN